MDIRRRSISNSSSNSNIDNIVFIKESLELLNNIDSSGCVFYLPLNTEESIIDLINGAQMEISSTPSFYTTFDNNKNMWHFKIAEGAELGKWCARIKTNWTLDTFLYNEISILAKILIVKPASQRYILTILITTEPDALLLDKGTCHGTFCLMPNNLSSNTNYWEHGVNNPDTFAHIITSDSRLVYSNGEFNSTSPNNYYTPNYFMSHYNGYLHFGGVVETIWQNNTEYYISKLMVFNRTLSKEDIDYYVTQSLDTSILVLYPQCNNLTITADNVKGNHTLTAIQYAADIGYYTEDGILKYSTTKTGIIESAKFPLNQSYNYSIERIIGLKIFGKTATTTITQGVWVDLEYTINLNSQWLKSSIANPDLSLYDGVYESYSNKGVGSSGASMYITINGYSNFKLYIRSYAESSYDYVMVSQLDKTLTYSSSYSDTSLVISHTRGSENSGTSIGSYKLVEFTNIDGDEHTILIIYRKDSSVDIGDDCGYVLIPKDQ